MNTDDYILSALSDESKSWTVLKREIVPKICAKGTLSKHLQDLENEGRIKKVLHEDRTTTYSLMPESLESARSSKDVVTLESLIKELGHKTRKDLQLEEVKLDEVRNWGHDLQRAIGPTRNYPKMNFGLQLDENTLRIVNLVHSSSELADELEKSIRNKLNDIKQKMPATIKDEWREFTSHPMNWNDVNDYARKIALKHGLRFLIFSWYDGGKYKKKILHANKNLEKLKQGHEEDISFLDEINRRCYYSSLEYYYEEPAILEETIRADILKISNPYQLLKNAFLFYHGEGELMWLEAALVSEGAMSQLPKDVFKKELDIGLGKIHSPYDIIKFEEYIKMKLSLVKSDSRKILVKDLLETFSHFLRSYHQSYPSDYRLHPDDYHQAIDFLIEKLNISEQLEKTSIKSPVLNFTFDNKEKKVDFSNETLVKNFLTFLSDPSRKKWLRKCLSLGLPIFPNIPFVKLGFAKKNIL